MGGKNARRGGVKTRVAPNQRVADRLAERRWSTELEGVQGKTNGARVGRTLEGLISVSSVLQSACALQSA